MANVRMVRGTQEKYDELPSKDNNAVYFLTDTQSIYLGDIKMSTDAEIEWGDIEAQRRLAAQLMRAIRSTPVQPSQSTIIIDNIDSAEDIDTSSIIVDDIGEQGSPIIIDGVYNNAVNIQSPIVDGVSDEEYDGEPIIID